MLHLLKAEWLKTKGFYTFWIISGLFCVLLPLFNYQFSRGMMGSGEQSSFLSDYSFPGVWSSFGFWASFFILFIAFLIIINITNEYRYKTSRQNIIDGWSRLQFFHAKCLSVVIVSFLTAIYSGLWCVIFGYGTSNSFSGMTENIEKVFYLFILCLNYYGFAMMLAFLVKRSGLAIGLFMLYSLVIESILKGYLNWQFANQYIGNFLPLQASDELLPFPLLQQMQSITGQAQGTPSDAAYLVTSFIYIALYYFISKRKILRSDW